MEDNTLEAWPSTEGDKEKLLAALTHLRHGYSNEIPDKIIDSTHQDPEFDYRFKVRIGWVGMVHGYVLLGCKTGLLSRELGERTVKFREEWETRPDGLTTAEDIDTGNEILDDALAELSKE